jgi:MFS family permease
LNGVAAPVVAARGLRGFADGLVSVALPGYVLGLGLGPRHVGAVVTATLLGSAALTLAAGLSGHRFGARRLLLAGCVLMALTGVGFAVASSFAVVLVLAFVGTVNPSGGDVTPFLPTEQAVVADVTEDRERPRVYARYNLAGTLAAALGALAAGVELLADNAFVVYAAVAGALVLLYRRLPGRVTVEGIDAPRGLGPSRRVVLRLAALFSLDAAGSGFAVQSILVLWVHLRFDLSDAETATLFAVASALAAASHLAAGRLAVRFGLVPTMVFTHLPANALLVLAAFAPNAPVAVALLLGRAALSQMDVAARQAFVMSVVAPAERAAAAAVTNVPRSLASAVTPFAAGALLEVSDFGWPLVLAGATKIAYDLLLLRAFGQRS